MECLVEQNNTEKSNGGDHADHIAPKEKEEGKLVRLQKRLATTLTESKKVELSGTSGSGDEASNRKRLRSSVGGESENPKIIMRISKGKVTDPSTGSEDEDTSRKQRRGKSIDSEDEDTNRKLHRSKTEDRDVQDTNRRPRRAKTVDGDYEDTNGKPRKRKKEDGGKERGGGRETTRPRGRPRKHAQQQQQQQQQLLLHPSTVDTMAEKLEGRIRSVLHRVADDGDPDPRLRILSKRLKQVELQLQQKDAKEGELRLEYEQKLRDKDKQHELQLQQKDAELRLEYEQKLRDKELQCKQVVEATKKKQWCALCGKEALFYCCWNTSYCDYPCQQQHWPAHMASCAQRASNAHPTPNPPQTRRRLNGNTPFVPMIRQGGRGRGGGGEFPRTRAPRRLSSSSPLAITTYSALCKWDQTQGKPRSERNERRVSKEHEFQKCPKKNSRKR